MYAVIFEVAVKETGEAEYLRIAQQLREQLVEAPGFISIERFSSLVNEGKLLSLSFWENEQAIQVWKSNLDHQQAQNKGRQELFQDYRIRVAKVIKDYTMETSDFEK